MRRFENDYSEGAAPEVLRALTDASGEQNPGYGEDRHSAHAADLVRDLCELGPEACVRFVPGGTAANVLAIQGLCDEFEGPICARDAHPTIHETGAVEACGRRLLASTDPMGVLTPEGAERVFRDMTATSYHTTRPAMVHIAHTSEFGHVWSAEEFDALCDWADDRDLAVYVDGARVACAVMSEGADLTLAHIARRADAFTLGGTKNGLLFGEALVVTGRTGRSRRMAAQLPYRIKRQGVLTAKGFATGIQFEAALEGGRACPWLRWAEQADRAAVALRRGLVAVGYEPYGETLANQQFFWATPEQARAFAAACGAEQMIVPDREDDRVVVRFVTSWATPVDAADELVALAASLS